MLKDGKDRSLSLSLLERLELQFCALVSVHVNSEEEVFCSMSWKFTHTCKNVNEINLLKKGL